MSVLVLCVITEWRLCTEVQTFRMVILSPLSVPDSLEYVGYMWPAGRMLCTPDRECYVLYLLVCHNMLLIMGTQPVQNFWLHLSPAIGTGSFKMIHEQFETICILFA
jgi:hypothetical protein